LSVLSSFSRSIHFFDSSISICNACSTDIKFNLGYENLACNVPYREGVLECFSCSLKGVKESHQD
jgi:hypothetical protein